MNLRKSASTSSTIIGKLQRNQSLTVHSQSNGWAKVTAIGKTGYVSTQYIAKSKPKAAATTDYKSKAISVAKNNIGVKYVWGGTTPKGFDCSGLVKYSFAQAGKTLPRTAAEMYGQGTKVSTSSLKAGDLMFYATSGGSKVTHVAIYIGNGQIIHSTSTNGVRIDNISNSYWKPRFVGAKRL
ncbi:peptidase P60 [Jeotgalibacillus proteolyticus]|uniref:Peptidase P60 n=1 Tax=Jeotgalibacillus proteolyticus TaxID=2082395 RepID=A0A2S5G878_9BACL|nr:peptidase P60 [Jeotgalibacillus proteolyticus]